MKIAGISDEVLEAVQAEMDSRFARLNPGLAQLVQDLAIQWEAMPESKPPQIGTIPTHMMEVLLRTVLSTPEAGPLELAQNLIGISASDELPDAIGMIAMWCIQMILADTFAGFMTAAEEGLIQ